MLPSPFRWLAGASLLAGLIPQLGAEPPARPGSDFYHKEWNGLGAVFDIKRSTEGFVWLTTSKGVARFDGVRFQSVGEVTRGAVQDSEIDSVFLSPSGGLWLTTEGAGLLLWKDGKLTAFPDRRCTPARKQGQLVEDRDGSLWVQATAGLFRLRGSVCEQVGADQGYPGGFPAGVFLDSGGTLWVKTQTGPLLFLPRGQSRFEASANGRGVSTGYAYVREAPDGGIWLSDDQGLRRVETARVETKSSPGSSNIPDSPPSGTHKGSPPFGDFAFAPDGSLWAVTSSGVRRFDHPEQWPAPVAKASAPGEDFSGGQELSSDAVWKVLVDRGGVWVGTNSGLDRLRRAPLVSVRLPSTSEHEFAVAAGEKGSVWTGNSNLPLTHVASDGTVTTIPGTRQILSVRRDHRGSIWAAGTGDAYLWGSSGKGFSPLHYPEENLDAVVFTATDRNGDPWITTRSGRAYHLSGGLWGDETKELGKKPGVVGAMVDDQAGNLWFAFSNKVVCWDGSVYRRFSFPDGQRGVSENTMSVRGDHVWLGGAGGVQLFTQGNFHIMRWKDSGGPGRVSGLVETETGDLWINGFSGITHVAAGELKKWLKDPSWAVSAEHLDELDGLPGLSGEMQPEPSLVEAPDGKLWFATTRGIASLDPIALEKNRNPQPPVVLVSAIVSNGKAYSSTAPLTLPPHTESLEIDYTALSLSVPERTIFRYKLDGVDQDWQNAGTRREAYYTKLRPGNYRFHVIARNSDGIWNDAGAALNFEVAPAWFQTDWFLGFCIAAGAYLVWLLYRFRVRQVAAGMNARFDERLAERTRIGQELHDTLLQGFLSASMQVHIASDILPDDSTAKPILNRALEIMNQVIDEGRNAVRGLRLSQSASLDLEQAFARIQQELAPEGAKGRGIGFRVIAEGQRRVLHPLIRDEVYRIGREALTNAFRHARASHIDVELNYRPNQFRLLIRDDGHGIEPNILHAGRDGHFGLCGMRERADRIGAQLHIFSSPAAGTEVELSVPSRAAFQDQPNGGLGWFRKRPRPRSGAETPESEAQGARNAAPNSRS